ncbi:MAG: hypothetical protein K2O34_03700 [Acetatifactor sp.]|nr:hypothetical protein [Acetatifactor sp.]
MKRINMAIMGAGNIARHMAEAIGGLQEQVCAYAVASRSLDKAEAFAEEWHYYEYEVLACVRAMEAGALECQEMPHSETIEIMEQMDRLRRDWGVAYPFEKAEG